jgi:hypothetical protein
VVAEIVSQQYWQDDGGTLHAVVQTRTSSAE